MTPLEYLVPGRPRRELLKTLRSEKRGLTVRQLSRRVGVAYSNAHREVGLLTRLGLLHPERVGNALVCRWDPENPVAKALEPLFAGQPDEETLYANLKRWGAPLVRGGTPREKFSLEETLGRALVLARHHPDVARVWPVAFAKNRREVNLSELVMVARSFGQKRALGFFLSLTAGLLKDPSLAKSARHLSDGRARRVEDFFLFSRGDRARRLAEENAPRAAKEWLFRMNMPMDSFESLFRKFV